MTFKKAINNLWLRITTGIEVFFLLCRMRFKCKQAVARQELELATMEARVDEVISRVRAKVDSLEEMER